MRASTRRASVPGPAGRIELAVDAPGSGPHGVALIAHPHPLYGGTLDNKVVQTLARAFVDLGYVALRPNFRGVGGSDGGHDGGRGEVDDLGCVLDWARSEFGAAGGAPPVLAGFSFGAAMVARLHDRLHAAGARVGRLVLVGVAVGGFPVPPTLPADALVVHGEHDETVPLAEVLDWLRPQEVPLLLVPGCDHFFHHKLHLLKAIVLGAWKHTA